MSKFKFFREIVQIFAVRTPPPPAAVPLPFQANVVNLRILSQNCSNKNAFEYQ